MRLVFIVAVILSILAFPAITSAQDVNSATYSAVNDTITITGGSPTFQNLYVFDQTYNWGQITTCGTDCFNLDCAIVSGTDTGVKIDANVAATITGTSNLSYIINECPPCDPCVCGTPCVSGTEITSWMEDNIIGWLEEDMLFIGEILLIALLTGLAFWRQNMLLYLVASAVTGMIGADWWDNKSINYGMPTAGLSLVLLFKFAWQPISGHIKI